MAQPGNFTPILLYSSSTPSSVPLATNLTNSANGSEIALNIADKNLFFKDSTNAVNTVPIRQSSGSSNGWLSSTDWTTFNGKANAFTYTTGYIPFGQGTTTPNQSANLFWDNTNARLGLGTTSPAQKLSIYDAASAAILMQGDAAANITIQRYSTNSIQPSLILFKARGTLASPTAVASDDQMGSVVFQAYGGTNTRSIASIRAYVETYTSDTNISSYLWFGTAPAGGTTLTERMRIFGSGGVSIGNTTDPGTGGLRISGLMYPQQAATASAPAYVKGAIYFDTTLNKLRVGGATAWETITSV